MRFGDTQASTPSPNGITVLAIIKTIGKLRHLIVEAMLLGNHQAFEPSNRQILSISPEKFATNFYLNA